MPTLCDENYLTDEEFEFLLNAHAVGSSIDSYRIEQPTDILSGFNTPLEEILMNRNAVDQGMIHLQNNVYFNKLGKDITTQITTKLATLASDIETRKGEVSDICKKREVKLDEVLKDKDMNALMEGNISEDAFYANSVSTRQAYGSANDAPINLGKAVMEDLKKIINAAKFIVSTTEHCKHLKRVQENLNKEETYKLFYDDLLKFGF